MYRKALAEAEATGTKVTTMSGHLLDVNRTMLKEGLELTPAYKLRVKLGFTKIIQRPTAANGYHLIMGR